MAKRKKKSKIPMEWKLLGGMRADDGTLILLIQCWGGHIYMHKLTEYPDHDSIFTTCPECNLKNAIVNFTPGGKYIIE
jgi:hypothetical protein